MRQKLKIPIFDLNEYWVMQIDEVVQAIRGGKIIKDYEKRAIFHHVPTMNLNDATLIWTALGANKFL